MPETPQRTHGRRQIEELEALYALAAREPGDMNAEP
jgi:hypothetical protein